MASRASFLDRALSQSSSPSPRRPHLSRRRGTSRYDPKPYLDSFTERASELARTRLFRVVVLPGAVLVLVIVWLSSGGGGAQSVSGKGAAGRRSYARGDFGCEQKGLVSGNLTDGGRFDRQRVTIRIEPSTHTKWNEGMVADKVHETQFHPALSAQLASDAVLFFNDSQHSGELIAPPAYSGKCLQPVTHQLPLTLKRKPRPYEPTFHFSMCTSPSRAITMAPVWAHFASAPTLPSSPRHPSPHDPNPDRVAPSCLVTDAVGDNDLGAYQRADETFAANGLRCRMRTSSRVGARYEMRVLGLLTDAWKESERRRWQDGDKMVEWFVFGDDDTFWTDQEDLKDLLASYDWRQDVMLGGFSEAKQNFANHGEIAYGGAGIVISRTLVRKMQPFVDKCANRFAHVFGGDGLLTSCAAYVQSLPLDEVVTQTAGMNQMDMQGDASGFLQAGKTVLTLHHWWGWLDLFPKKGAMDSILLLSAAARVVGGRNLFKRWVFDGGRVAMSLGYSVTLYKEPLTDDDLGKLEWTWDEFEPIATPRPERSERTEKLSFFLTEVKHIGPNLALLRHTCEDASVANGTNVVDVLWDTRQHSFWRR